MEFNGLKITWLGHAAVRLELPGGEVCLVDPWLQENPACPESEKTPVAADAIYVTHGHFDHLGDTVELAKRLGCQVFCNHEIAGFLESQGVEKVVGLNFAGEVEGPGGITATLVPAVHSSGITTPTGLVEGGSAGGWVFASDDHPTLYHAGDTALFGDMSLIGEWHKPDIGLLPIGGHFTMGPKQAAQAAKNMDLMSVIPIHYGTFPILSGTPGELEKAAESHFKVVVPETGKPLERL